MIVLQNYLPSRNYAITERLTKKDPLVNIARNHHGPILMTDTRELKVV